MTPAWLKNLQSLLTDMLLPASKDVVHHDSMLCFCLQLLVYMLSVSHRQHCQYTVYCDVWSELWNNFGM